MSKTIAVDFDGVIHAYRTRWRGGEIYDVPVEGSLSGLRRLIYEDYDVVILTARENHQAVRDWLVEWGWDFDQFPLRITSIKPPAIAYVDDRAIRFTNWQDIRNYFT